MFLRILQNSQENTCARASFLNKFARLKSATSLKTDSMYSCEFCEIFKNTFVYRTPLVAASLTGIQRLQQTWDGNQFHKSWTTLEIKSTTDISWWFWQLFRKSCYYYTTFLQLFSHVWKYFSKCNPLMHNAPKWSDTLEKSCSICICFLFASMTDLQKWWKMLFISS